MKVFRKRRESGNIYYLRGWGRDKNTMTAKYTRKSRVRQRGGQMEQASALLTTEQKKKLQANEMQASQEQRHIRLQSSTGWTWVNI